MRQSLPEFSLPGLDQEEGYGAGRMDGQPRDARIDACIPSLTAVSVTGMGTQGSDSLCGRGQAAEDLSHIVRDEGGQVGSAGRQGERFLTRVQSSSGCSIFRPER